MPAELAVAPAVLLVAARSSEKELAPELGFVQAFAPASDLELVAAIRLALDLELGAATRLAPDFALAAATALEFELQAHFVSDLPKSRLCCEFETAALAAAVAAAVLAFVAQAAAPVGFAAEFAVAPAEEFAEAFAAEIAPELAARPVAQAQAATLELSCCRYSFKLLVIFTKIYALILSRNVV